MLETLVALALALLLLTMLSRSFLTIWHGTAHAREDLQGMLVAQSVLESALPRVTLAPGVRTGTATGYAWRAEIQPASTLAAVVTPASLPAGLQVDTGSDGGSPWRLYRIAVTVRTPTGRRVALDAFRLGN